MRKLPSEEESSTRILVFYVDKMLRGCHVFVLHADIWLPSEEFNFI